MEQGEYRRMFELERTHWWFWAKHRLITSLVRRFRPNLDGRVLDIGCGGGAVAELLHGLGLKRVVGLDFSPDAARFCRDRGVSAIIGEAHLLPCRAGLFDMVTAFDVLEHLKEDSVALSEIYRVLRPRGMFLMSGPACRFLWSYHDEVLHHFRRYGKGDLTQKLTCAGFLVEMVAHAYMATFPFLLGVRIFRSRRRVSESDLQPVHPILNAMLKGLMMLEIQLMSRVRLPIGTSLFVVARKGPVEG